MITDNDISNEIQKAFGFLKDQTYNATDFQAHLQTFFKDQVIPTIAIHKEQVERLIKETIELRTLQKKYFAKRSDKTLIECKEKELALDNKLKNLLSSGIYSIDRFIKEPPQQGGLFN